MRCWLGYDIECAFISEMSKCKRYSNGGVVFRMLRGYCPIPDDGPTKPKPKEQTKVRSGQQKQRKRK